MTKRTIRTKPKLLLRGRLVGFWLLILAIISPLGGGAATAAWAAARPDTPEAQAPPGPADFDTCARLAIRQSPFFTKSSLEIEVKKLDAADSKSDFFPSFYFSSKYYLSQPRNPWTDHPNEYYLALSTGDYNPILAMLSLRVKKVIIEIVTLGHMKVIAMGLERLGKAFLELQALERLAQVQKTKTEQARENLRYYRERQAQGEVTSMEVQIAAQEAEVASAEQDTTAASQAKLKEVIRSFLGLKPEQPLTLEVAPTRRQVLGDFDPAKASREQGEDRSFDLRIKKLIKELQKLNVILAKMRFLPNVNLGLQTPDPITQSFSQHGTFFYLGLKFPIFEGFKRTRNITRQQTILKQYASEEQVTAVEFSQEWREAEANYKKAATTLKVAQTQAELARLKERQAETLYRTGEKDFSVLLAARQARVKAETDEVKAALGADLAALTLRHLSGELVYKYVHEDQFKQAN